MIHSAVFERMFLSNTKEAQSGTVKIKDMSADVIQLLISYLNSGKIGDGLNKHAEDLFVAADKYAIEKLQVCFFLFMGFPVEGFL
jgi:hypothetical protein